MTIKTQSFVAVIAALLLGTGLLPGPPVVAVAQQLAAAGDDDARALKHAALEALMHAPPERALSLVIRTLERSDDEELKERALFILSQIDLPQARDHLLQVALQGNTPRLRREAIRSIGIGGDSAALERLVDVYRGGNEDTREAVLRAFLIADEEQFVLQIARAASDDDEFDAAVRVLGAMGAVDALATLRDRATTSAGLIQAYAVANDLDSLEALLAANSDPDLQRRIMRAMGIVGGSKVGQILAQQYRTSTDEDVRHAALQGLLVAGDDKTVIELFRWTSSDAQKRDLLRLLVNMGSDEALDLIDSTLSEDD
ncbi:MAG: HEAT repeat domain-containing protein [Gammaproteobacteria bacterium]